jgi:hypothetical protein
MKRLIPAAVLALAFLAITGTAEAASPTYWTIAQAQAALKQPNTSIYSVHEYASDTMVTPGFIATVDGRSIGVRGNVVRGASCRGFGTRHRTGFAAFRCDVQFSSSSDISGTVFRASIWMRLLLSRMAAKFGPGRTVICASTRTLADCPPPLPARPLPGDPRVCSSGSCTTLQKLGNVASPAHIATSKKLRAEGITGSRMPSFGCLATSAFVYRCTYYKRPDTISTVRFVQGKTRWTTVVTLSYPPPPYTPPREG